MFVWGSLQGRNRDLSYDPELLYIGAMFHDLGLNEEYRHSDRRFEVSSADEARRFLRGDGIPEDSTRRVWTAIALHTTPGIPEWMKPEVALVAAGVETDVLGIGYHDISDADGPRSPPCTPGPTSSARSCRRSTTGWHPGRTPPSAPSTPTSSSGSPRLQARQLRRRHPELRLAGVDGTVS